MDAAWSAGEALRLTTPLTTTQPRSCWRLLWLYLAALLQSAEALEALEVPDEAAVLLHEALQLVRWFVHH